MRTISSSIIRSTLKNGISKLKDYFYLEQSSCEKSNCGSLLCEKVIENNFFSIEFGGIPKTFNILSLDVFKSEFIYYQNEIDLYQKECKIEKYMKENIAKLKSSTTNQETLQIVSDYFKETCKKVRKNDKTLLKKNEFNEKALEDLQLNKDLSFEYFLLAYLSSSSVKNFFLRNYSGPDEYFNNIKTLIRKLHSKDQKITLDEFKDFYNAGSEKISSKKGAKDAIIKFTTNLKIRILNSRVQLSKLQKQEILETFKLKCTQCQNEFTKIISPFVLKVPHQLAFVSYSTYSLAKSFDFYLPIQTSIESLKSKIQALTPEIDPDKLLVLDTMKISINGGSLTSRVWVYENPSKISSLFGIKSASLSYSLNSGKSYTIYYFVLRNSKDIVKEDIRTILGTEFSIDFSSQNLEQLCPDIRVQLSKHPSSYFRSKLRFLLDKPQLYDCINCNTPSAVIENYPDNFLVYYSAERLTFKLGDYFYQNTKLIAHQLKAVTLFDSSKVKFTTYLTKSPKKMCMIDEDCSAEEDSNILIISELVVMLYSVFR